ncbi:STAS domain-containing protein [Streptomyces sp. NPDC004393]|uniref:STAS domain-containing protein n=1 Tax=Streptomyces sp. NPDC004533 TaxID=3154278 RepID=UPI0033AE174D
MPSDRASYGPGRTWGRLVHLFRRRRWGFSLSTPTSGRVVVRLSGQVTSANAERIGRRLRGLLVSHPTAVLEIDLGDVTYLSGSGGAAFFMALRTARERGTHVMITHVHSQARHTLRRLGLARVLDVYEWAGPSESRDGDQ